ncbi:hypothetical protein N0O92_12525 [Alkalihalobacillus sp. MEB130]|uniref:hypothetical protein n=1 Tax=Alkalihalobacillus sp. MEB130 TaxID=2976704 RepID=UPI0028DF651D|nr:hypothetical protein [Alkalihalobacillus sp. MEB130]MDT8861060.1 hypothetical protein [Alkalihalobacillus sp. MEB130]
MKRSDMRLDEYTNLLWQQRKKETINESAENLVSLKNGKGLTSPSSELPTEELKMLQQYMHRSNLINMGKALPEGKKALVLRKFFKHKRNQQVEVFVNTDKEPIHFLGKVNTIGRDFVTLITLKDRIWIPFANIESAKVPYGLPEVSSTHQHFAYDEKLRTKLITRFSETVANKDVLIQQFFEESLQTNLQTWKNTRVQVTTNDREIIGKIIESKDGKILLKCGKDQRAISINDIILVKTVRLFNFLSLLGKQNRQVADE